MATVNIFFQLSLLFIVNSRTGFCSGYAATGGVLRCLRPATLLKNRLWHRFFPVNFAKFLRTFFLQNTSGRQLLSGLLWKYVRNSHWNCSVKKFAKFLRTSILKNIYEEHLHLLLKLAQISLTRTTFYDNIHFWLKLVHMLWFLYHNLQFRLPIIISLLLILL